MHASRQAFYIRKWPNQENITEQTICLNFSFETYGHLVMFQGRSLEARERQVSGHHSRSRVACPLLTAHVAHLPSAALREGLAGGCLWGCGPRLCSAAHTGTQEVWWRKCAALFARLCGLPHGHTGLDLGARGRQQ